jgi:pyruvate ferredoxin oxidoreductase gamma subunit
LKYVKRPVPNAALLGAFAAISGRITLDAVKAAITEKFPGKVGEGNIAAATAAYEAVKAN